MPTYEYKCEQCGFLFEVSHSMRGSHDLSCPKCGSGAKRIITGGSGFIIKGSGSGTVNDTKGTKCGKEQTCCGKATPCDVRPCDK
jgi:putative FmdB family regulatory protein